MTVGNHLCRQSVGLIISMLLLAGIFLGSAWLLRQTVMGVLASLLLAGFWLHGAGRVYFEDCRHAKV